jgi:Ser/Thr protein kinase RdoA (MazF antagonist)
MNDSSATPYYRLDPNAVLQAIESTGMLSDGRLLALNSYENRVYQVGIEGSDPVVAKFYRPERWSDAQIIEEHEFTAELEEDEIPVVGPLRINGETLHFHEGFRFAIFPRRGGRPPELEDSETLKWLGRFIGRAHVVGGARPFEHRPALNIERYGEDSVRTINEGRWIPPHLEASFNSLAADLLASIRNCYDRAGGFTSIRLHADCHPGNILWRDGPIFVDLDDCQSGPAVQDLWMLLSGSHEEMSAQLNHVLEGYSQFCTFNHAELHLIEALRTLRMLHHAAWLARRWEDPAFPIAFPWFGEPRYWEALVLGLREQLGAMQEAPLQPG